MSSTGERARRPPTARTWRPMTSATSSTSAGSHVEARPMACGKFVAPGAIKPDRASSWARAGMPRRVRSSRKLLDPVDGLGRGARIEPGARDAGDLADAVRQVPGHPLVIESALDEQVRVPDPRQLGSLLLEGHPPEEVVDVGQSSTSSASRRISSTSSRRSHPSPTSSSRRWSKRPAVAGRVAVQRAQLRRRRRARRCRPSPTSGCRRPSPGWPGRSSGAHRSARSARRPACCRARPWRRSRPDRPRRRSALGGTVPSPTHRTRWSSAMAKSSPWGRLFMRGPMVAPSFVACRRRAWPATAPRRRTVRSGCPCGGRRRARRAGTDHRPRRCRRRRYRRSP